MFSNNQSISAGSLANAGLKLKSLGKPMAGLLANAFENGLRYRHPAEPGFEPGAQFGPPRPPSAACNRNASMSGVFASRVFSLKVKPTSQPMSGPRSPFKLADTR